MTLPGTTIEVGRYTDDVAEDVLGHIFCAGGIVLSQVTALTGVPPHDVQNWVKRGFLPPPEHRMYDRRRFVRIVIINMLRESMQIDRVPVLLSYINGDLCDDSDDSIDDDRLYNLLVNLLARTGEGLPDKAALSAACDEVLADFVERVPHSRLRIREVLMVMVCAWKSALAKQMAEVLMTDILSAALPPPPRDARRVARG
ncbi:MAG: DUF1836 domain-containing protein [Clostridia bacterium]|nr:DUF1836 domain-containing protein [Clostridia bacterium]